MRTRRAELARPLADCLVGDGDAALGEQVFDVAEAKGEPLVQPHGLANDLRREPVTSIHGLHRSMVTDNQELDNTLQVPWG